MTYTMIIETPGKPLSSAMGVRYNSFDTLSSGQMYADGAPTGGDLSMAVYYHYDMQTLLGDIAAAISQHLALVLSWLCLILPGLALLLWLPNSMSNGQRLIAAPGLSVLALPVFMLITRALHVAISTGVLWALVLISGVLILAALARPSLVPQPQTPQPTQTRAARLESAAFWSSLVGVLILTAITKLLPLRDALAGMGLDAYHHTLISEMFIRAGGIPSNYEPYAPLASFTYHFGFHALTATLDGFWASRAPKICSLSCPRWGNSPVCSPS